LGVEVGGFVLERAGVGEGGGGGGEGRGGFQDLVFGSGLLELQLKPLVLLGDGEGVLLERRELGLEVFDVALFALPEGSLAVALSLCIGEENGEEGGGGGAYAARFWALRLDWAGVMSLSSSSLLLPLCVSSAFMGSCISKPLLALMLGLC
jgi:hypothetical protein